MIRISQTDFENYGCPNCGCSQIARCGNDHFSDYVICMECGTDYAIVPDLEARKDISDELKEVINFTNSEEFKKKLDEYENAKKAQISYAPDNIKSSYLSFDQLIG